MALLLMGFAGAHRRSELVALTLADVTPHPTDGLHVRLRTSKTDQEAKGTVKALPYGRDPVTCPPCAYVRWRPGGALFPTVHKNGVIGGRAMSGDAIAETAPAGVGARRDMALLQMGSAGAHRRSELVALTLADVTLHSTDGLHVRLRRSKVEDRGA